MSPIEIAEDLITQLTSQEGKVRPPMTLALYSSHGSHSVTPTAVTRNEDGYVIEVYDSNWPGISREVNIDSGGVWTYQELMKTRHMNLVYGRKVVPELWLLFPIRWTKWTSIVSFARRQRPT